MNDGTTPSLDRIVDAIRRGPYAEAFADPARRRAKLYETLARSKDPLLREIGTQLRDGKVSLREVLGVGVYRDHLMPGGDEPAEGLGKALRTAGDYFTAKAEEHERGRAKGRGDRRV